MSLERSLGVLLAMVGFVVGAAVLTDNSLLTHIATGELILERGSVPSTDPYSATARGEPWTVQSWLVSVLYAVVHGAAGPAGLRILHGFVAAAVAVGVWVLVSPARQVVTRTGLAMIPIGVGLTFWSPRPLMFGLLGVVAVLLALRGLLPPWMMVPVMWVWVNSHGSFPLAVVLIGAVVVGAGLDDKRWPSAEGRVLAWTVGGTLAGALNPIGPAILWFPIQMLGRREALQGVLEWSAPQFKSVGEWLFLALVPLLVLAATRGARGRELVPGLVVLAAGLLAIRNINVASIVVVAAIAPALTDLVGSADGAERGIIARAAAASGAVGLVVAVAAVAVAPGFDLDAYPIEEVEALERQDLVADPDVRLVHRDGVGNYLTFRYGPSAAVFIDDRFDFYPLEITADHLDLLEGGDVGEILDRRKADVVLWEADGSLAHWLRASDRWDVVLEGEFWVVACRRDGPVQDRCANL